MKYKDELKGILELLTKDSKWQIEWESFKPTRTNGILIFLIESVLELNEKLEQENERLRSFIYGAENNEK